MMTDGVAFLMSMIAYPHMLGYVVLLFVLFNKAGLHGGIMAVCVLPVVAVLSSFALHALMMMPSVGDRTVLAVMAGNAVFFLFCNLAPLLVLAIKKWPVIASVRTGDL